MHATILIPLILLTYFPWMVGYQKVESEKEKKLHLFCGKSQGEEGGFLPEENKEIGIGFCASWG